MYFGWKLSTKFTIYHSISPKRNAAFDATRFQYANAVENENSRNVFKSRVLFHWIVVCFSFFVVGWKSFFVLVHSLSPLRIRTIILSSCGIHSRNLKSGIKQFKDSKWGVLASYCSGTFQMNYTFQNDQWNSSGKKYNVNSLHRKTRGKIKKKTQLKIKIKLNLMEQRTRNAFLALWAGSKQTKATRHSFQSFQTA